MDLEDRVNAFIDSRPDKDVISAPSLQFFAIKIGDGSRFYAGLLYETREEEEGVLEDTSAR